MSSELRLPPFRLIHAAYVTRDLQLGMRRLGGAFGLDSFHVYPTGGVGTPNGTALLEVAVSGVGGGAVEVIQPVGGDDEIYRRFLPDDPSNIALHHFASRILGPSEWDMVMDAVRSRHLDTPVRGEADGFKYIYLDLRSYLGHILEFIWYENPEIESKIESMAELQNIN
jgi:hypothetical protein